MSVSRSPTLPPPAASRADPHLEALLVPFSGSTRERIKTMIERALKLGHEREAVWQSFSELSPRYDRALAAGPAPWAADCSEARREHLKRMESELAAMEWRVDAIDRQFQGVSK